MRDPLNKTITTIQPSGIRKFFDVVHEMKDAISLGVGEPDFPTPEHVREAAIASIKRGETKYTDNRGTVELRAASAEYLEKFGLHYDRENEILITMGASEGIDLALRALVDPGDEVLVVEPCYVSYIPCVELCGGIPVSIPLKAENKFRLTKEELEEKITDKTKVLLISFPNNPTGAIMTKEQLAAIVPVIIKHDILCLSDEVYSELTYDGLEHVSIATFEGMRERTFVFNGFSKGFAMTGWRVGYVCAPKEMMVQTMKVHQFAIMCAPTASQHAANALLEDAFETDFNEVKTMVAEYDRKRRRLYKALLDMGLDCFEPKGAFYMFPSVKSTGITGDEFSERLLMEYKVCVPAGEAFGESSGSEHIRISYAYSIEQLEKGIDRMAAFVKELKSK